MYCIAPAELNIGPARELREEAREEAEAKMRIHAEYVQQLIRSTSVLFVREGDIREELLGLIDEEPASAFCSGADTTSGSAGPIISFLMAVRFKRVPITVVPGI